MMDTLRDIFLPWLSLRRERRRSEAVMDALLLERFLSKQAERDAREDIARLTWLLESSRSRITLKAIPPCTN